MTLKVLGMTQELITSVLPVVQTLARDAGKLAFEKRKIGVDQMSKGDRDIVTIADTEAQALMTRKIRELFPSHGFHVEEKDDTLPKNQDVMWIIDPIDGTANYAHFLHPFAISIGVALGNEVIVGAVYDPLLDELFSAAKGQGAFLNGERIQVNDEVKTLPQAIIGSDIIGDNANRTRLLEKVMAIAPESFGFRMFGCAALALSWIAAGRLDGFFTKGLAPWDVAGVSIILKEAGGEITDFNGVSWSWQLSDNTCVGANRFIHPVLVEVLNRH